MQRRTQSSALDESCSPRYLSTVILAHRLLPSRHMDIHSLAIHLRRCLEHDPLHLSSPNIDVEVSIPAEVGLEVLYNRQSDSQRRRQREAYPGRDAKTREPLLGQVHRVLLVEHIQRGLGHLVRLRRHSSEMLGPGQRAQRRRPAHSISTRSPPPQRRPDGATHMLMIFFSRPLRNSGKNATITRCTPVTFVSRSWCRCAAV